MSLFNLTVFSGFQLSTERCQIIINSKKAKALLAYLALHPNQLHQRESLATLLWEECNSTQARHSLRQSVSALRKAIPDSEKLIEGDQQTLSLNKGVINVDVLKFDELSRQTDKSSLVHALDLYQGELLEGLYTRSQGFDDWLETERSHRREIALQIMHGLLALSLSEAQLDQTIRLGIKIIAQDPLNEPVHRVLMDTYHKQGRRSSALKQYRLCQKLLRDELDIAPEKETQSLYQSIYQQQKQPTKIARQTTLAPNNPEEKESQETVAASGQVSQLRQVTLLLAQIHTPQAELDPEQLYHQHQQIFDELKQCIHRFQARVIEMHNDSLVILLGLPMAQSNDTEKAIRTAFAMQNTINTPDQNSTNTTIKIGISSGKIYIPDDNQIQPKALSGVTFQQALMLVNLAQPGQILIANRAYTTIAALVTADQLAVVDSIDHKPVWLLTGIEKNCQSSAGNLVGRQFELQQFITIANNCKNTRCGQLILVRGEPGIGKTRLLKEWQKLARDQGFNSHIVSIFDFGTEMDQNPVPALVRALLQLTDEDSLMAIKARAMQTVTDNILLSEQLNFLFDLLNIPELLLTPELYQAMDHEARDAGKQEILSLLVQRFSNSNPVLLIMEDIHWAEPALLALLGQLVCKIKDYPVILVFSTRPDSEPMNPIWRSQLQSASLLTLDLSPLRQNEAQEMIRQKIDLPDNKSAEIIQRSGGNPLFLQQLLLCAQQADAAIPDSVQSIIAAHLDTLSTFDKRAAFVASILGQLFSLDTLNDILGTPDYHCTELISRGLIRPEGRHFLFHHALIMEGVYAIQLPTQRRSLHLLAAEWYQNRDPVLYARHLDKAASDQAAHAYLSAAEQLIKLYQYDSAEKMASRGRELTTDTTTRFNLSICHADILRELGLTQSSLLAFQSAEQQAISPKQQCQALIGQGFALRQLDRHKEVLALITTCQPIAESFKDYEALASLHYLRGNSCFFLGDIDNCLLAHQQAESIAAQHQLPLIQARALSGIADAYYGMGRLITAKQKYHDCVALCKQHGFIRDITVNLLMIGAISGYLNRFDDAEQILLESLALARKVRNRRAEAMSLSELVYIYFETNRQNSGRVCANQCLLIAKQIGSNRIQSDVLTNLGTIDRNEVLLEQAYEIASTNPFGKYYISSWNLAVQAWITQDSNKRTWALQEGEKLLSKHALSHNHLLFYRYAIESCLDTKDLDKTRYYMAALKSYTTKEPLPWSEFIIQRAECLLRVAEGETGTELEHALQEQITLADQAKFAVAKTSLLTALQQIQKSGA